MPGQTIESMKHDKGNSRGVASILCHNSLNVGMCVCWVDWGIEDVTVDAVFCDYADAADTARAAIEVHCVHDGYK